MDANFIRGHFNVVPDNNLDRWPPIEVKDDASNKIISGLFEDLLMSGEKLTLKNSQLNPQLTLKNFYTVCVRIVICLCGLI